MQNFNFSRLVQKHSCEFTVNTLLNGYYDDSGDWVNGETKEITLQGAIIKRRDSKIFKSDGTITEQDRALFMLQPIEKALQGSKIVYQDNVYSIMNNLENAEFTGIWSYTLKYVSAFKDYKNNEQQNELDGEL